MTVRHAGGRPRLSVIAALCVCLITQAPCSYVLAQTPATAPATASAAAPDRNDRLRFIGPPILDPSWGVTWMPKPLIQNLLTLSDVVGFTLKNSPAIARAREDVALAAGRLREAKGVFDSVGIVIPGGAYLQQELTPSLRGFEQNRRDQLRILFTAFDGMNRGISEALESMQANEPYCPSALTFANTTNGNFIVNRLDTTETNVIGVDRDVRQELPIRIDQGIIRSSIGPIRLGDICRSTSSTGMGVGQTVDLWERINQTGRYRLDTVIDGLRALPTEINRFRQELTETIAVRSQLALDRLGPLPRDEIRKQITFEASVSKPLRNGLTLTGNVRLESEERNFRDKTLDPTFGGFAIQPRFPSFASGTLDLPLLRGRGAIVAAAPERAATLTLTAQRIRLRHLVTQETYRAVLAYINLVAAQDAVRFLEESATQQQDLTKLTQDLLDVGEVARSDLDRANARAAAVGAALGQRRLDLVAARASLVDVMGMSRDDLIRGPIAVETFAAPLPEPPGTASLMELARTQRLDPDALRNLEQASRILARAAAANLRRRLDLSITAGMSTFYESPYARFLPDEVNPIFSEISPPATAPGPPVRWSSWRGFGRSLTGEWKPFVRATVTFELPFANRTARGRAAQAGASLTRSQIEQFDLERRIRDNVNQVSGVVRSLGGVIEHRREATDALRRSLEASIEQFKIGELTLLDTIITEQNLTNELLQLTSDLQLYASAAARLAFETGSLVQFDASGTPLEKIAFAPLAVPIARRQTGE